MKTKSQSKALHRKLPQRGAALIILMLAIVLSLVTLVTFRSERKGPEQAAQRKTALALAQAKEALLGRAAADATHPGSLPCPDTNNDGKAQPFVGSNCPSYIGRLPWSTLGLPDLRDGNGERLWYKLSANFRDYTNPINTTTLGTLSISGTSSENGLAAIVFSPGAPIANQVRDVTRANDFTAYLEGYTTATDLNFDTAPNGPINDKLLVLRPNDLMVVATKRLVGELRPFLVKPYPTDMPNLATWVMTPNDWASQMIYTKLTDTSATLIFNGGCRRFNYIWDAVGEESKVTSVQTCSTVPW